MRPITRSTLGIKPRRVLVLLGAGIWCMSTCACTQPVTPSQSQIMQGSLLSTGNPLDVAIEGPGFFKIKLDPTINDGCGYTRMGGLSRSESGMLVVQLGEGYSFVPPVSLPSGATDISISPDGRVDYLPEGSKTRESAGTIKLTRFTNPAALKREEDCVFVATTASGAGIASNPGSGDAGTLLQTFLEDRTFDQSHKTLQAAAN